MAVRVRATTWTRRNTAELIASGVLEIGDGYRAKNSELGPKGLPFARAGNIDSGFHFEGADLLDEVSVPRAGNKVSAPGDIVFTSKGTVGRFAFVRPSTPRFVYSPQLCYWRTKEPSVIDPRFLHYWMHGREFSDQVFQVKGLTDMADYVSLTDQRRMMITLPPLPTQRKIAAILSAYDDLIENNTRRIAILEQMAQALYREWFVHFRFPGHERVRMVDSELGPIPEGWRVACIRDVAQVHRGRSYASTNLVDVGGLPFLNLKCLEREGGFRHDGIKRYDGPYKTSQIASEGDIIIAVTDMTQGRRIVARAARVPRMSEQMAVFSMDLIKVVPEGSVPRAFLYGMLRHSGFADEVKQHANGTNVLHLNPDRVEGFEFFLPPASLRELYAEYCTAFWNHCDTLQLRSDNLRRTRDLLLPKLVSGEVDVEGLEIEGVSPRP